MGSTDRRNASEVVGNVRAMQAALDSSGRLDERSVLAMHDALLRVHEPGIAGRYRDQQVWIGGTGWSPHGATFVPPHHEAVPV